MVVLCVDEKSEAQALDRIQKVCAMESGHNERRSHGYVRHGASILFAALEIVTGKVAGFFKDRYRHQEFLGFLKYVARAYLGREFYLVVDNYVAYKRVEVRHWHTSKPVYQGPLHPGVGVMVEPGRGLVRHHRASGHPTRYLRFSPRVDRQDPRIRQRVGQPEIRACQMVCVSGVVSSRRRTDCDYDEGEFGS